MARKYNSMGLLFGYLDLISFYEPINIEYLIIQVIETCFEMLKSSEHEKL